MPRNNQMPVCNFTKTGCLDDAKSQWPGEDEDYKKGMMPCKCFESCRNIKYRIKSQNYENLDQDGTFRFIKENFPG